jgi:hypothetical protein
MGSGAAAKAFAIMRMTGRRKSSAQFFFRATVKNKINWMPEDKISITLCKHTSSPALAVEAQYSKLKLSLNHSHMHIIMSSFL